MTFWSYSIIKRGEVLPKSTFFNLPEEKREAIIEAAILEFKENNFDSSSINKIVENSGISKGSFYQYFVDKKDLYKYIISLMAEKKLKYMSPVIENPFSHDFFTLLREMYLSGLSFAKDNPGLVAIGNRLLTDKSHPLYSEIIKENMDTSHQFFEVLLAKGIERGEIREGIDLKLTAYIITSLHISIADYYMENIKPEIDDDIMDTIDKFLELIYLGIGYRKVGGESDD